MEQGQADWETWESIVAAERKLAQLRAQFFDREAGRAELLEDALRSGGWQQTAALNLLAVLADDVPAVVPQLVDLALSTRTALFARRALSAASRKKVVPLVRKEVERLLPAADSLGYRRMAELLTILEDWSTLGALVRQALASNDAETREVGSDFEADYGVMLNSR